MKKLKIIPLKWVNEKHDTDGDKVPNFRDCNPWNPHKHASPYGIYPMIGGRFGVYKQTTLGATAIKKGNPVFVGRLSEAEAYLREIPPVLDTMASTGVAEETYEVEE